MAIKQWNNPPSIQIDMQKHYVASIVTAKGTIKLELYSPHQKL